MPSYHKIAIKVGSNVLTKSDGTLDHYRIRQLVGQIADLNKQDVQIILISSGAVASGRSLVEIPEKTDAVARRQILASIGQVKLMQTYSELFAEHQLLCSQVLVTKEDFRDRLHYLNMKNCFSALLQNKIIPIVNENDVISVTELMFTDNDELAGLIAAMLNVEALFILTNVNGIYNGNPENPESELIPEISPKWSDLSKFISTSKSSFGRGGMITKANIARRVANLGIAVHLLNGKIDEILLKIFRDEKLGTLFIPQKRTNPFKKWIAYSEGFAKGKIVVNEGAKNALLSETAHSLLLIGVIKIEGTFEKGDVVKIADENGNVFGLGMTQYNAQKAMEKIGAKNQKPLVHYDYLVLF